VCLVSLVGLPPLGGFVVKWWLIYALGSAALVAPVLWVVLAGVVINTAISLYYYARIIRQMYLIDSDAPSTAAASGPPAAPAPLAAPLPGKLVLHLCAVVLVLTGTLMVPVLKRGADYAAARSYAAPGQVGESLGRDPLIP
jgi:NADH:ubiquinone oxidoreductase subunit 2 (subunit N)